MPRTGMTPDEIKERTLEVAIEHMRKEGFEKLRLTEVAREIGVSHAALYSHFADKSALLDAVSERWLVEMDQKLDAICAKDEDPYDLIHEWAMYLHRSKVRKVKMDTNLYRAFDYCVDLMKPFVVRHLQNMERQTTSLVERATGKKSEAKKMSNIIRNATSAFHHPKLVAAYVEENREPLLKDTLDAVLTGLGIHRQGKKSRKQR